MKRHISSNGRLLKIVLLAVVFASGCTTDIPILRYPAFWQDDAPRSVVVLAFHNTSIDDPEAGNTISDRLATALMANGTYDQVYDRWDAQDMDMGQSSAGGWRFGPGWRKQPVSVDAIISGTVTSFEACHETDKYAEPIYEEDHHGEPVIVGYRAFTRNDAMVSVTATLTDRATGEVIHATQPAQSHIASEGSPPDYSMDVCLAMAVNQVIDQLVGELAIIRGTVSVDKGDALRITNGVYREGDWQEQDTFSPYDTEMTVVLNLPATADRNLFSLTIVRDGSGTSIAELDLVWSRLAPVAGEQFVFDPSQIAADGGGVGNYVVRFHAGGAPLIEQSFTIEWPEGEAPAAEE